jgi:hypothetical protein
MTDSKTSHKSKFDDFCGLQFSERHEFGEAGIVFYRREFEKFRSNLMDRIPDDEPKDKCMFETWMSEFQRQLDMARYSFLKARLAYCSKRVEGEKK